MAFTLSNEQKLNPAVTYDKSDNALRIVTPLNPDATQLKLYGLIGGDPIKKPYLYNPGNVFFFAEYGQDYPLLEGVTERPATTKARGEAWRSYILKHQASLCRKMGIKPSKKKPGPKEGASRKDPDHVDSTLPSISDDASLAKKVETALNIHAANPDSSALPDLISHLETRFPSLKADPQLRSFAQFFDYDCDISKARIADGSMAGFQDWLDENNDALDQMEDIDKSPAAYVLTEAVGKQLVNRWSIHLEIVEIMFIRATLRENRIFVPFSRAKALFRLIDKTKLDGNDYSIRTLVEDLNEVADSLAPSEPTPPTLSTVPSEVVCKRILKATREHLVKIMEGEAAKMGGLDKALGPDAASVSQIPRGVPFLLFGMILDNRWTDTFGAVKLLRGHPFMLEPFLSDVFGSKTLAGKIEDTEVHSHRTKEGNIGDVLSMNNMSEIEGPNKDQELENFLL